MMENLKAIGGLASFFKVLDLILGVLVAIAKFLFLTVWGWFIIGLCLVIIIYAKSRNEEGEFRISKVISAVTETALWFYTNLTTILIGLVVLLGVSFVADAVKSTYSALTLFKEVKTLEATLKNLKTERKVLEVTCGQGAEDRENMLVKVRYFAYSPVEDRDVASGEESYLMAGNKFYVDFGLINFDYSLVEAGARRNLAFPNRIFSDMVSYQSGRSIQKTTNNVPLTFSLDKESVYVLDQKDYNDEIARIMGAATNAAEGRKLGIKTTYGEAIAFLPEIGKTYEFYSTGTGGVIIKK